MNIMATALPGVLIIEPTVFSDDRGFFLETFQHDRYSHAGLPNNFVQDNISRSRYGVLRGLHFQLQQPQGKLVMVTRGKVFDVAVDVRYGSPTFGQSVSVILDDKHHRQLYVPPGFAHGFCVLSAEADFIYKCTDYYCPSGESGIIWHDPDLAIAWPLPDPLLSAKDQQYRRLSDIPAQQLPTYP